MRLSIDLSGDPDPANDLAILADITSGIAELMAEAPNAPGRHAALALDLVSSLIRNLAEQLPRQH
jgi:hypothetical protein